MGQLIWIIPAVVAVLTLLTMAVWIQGKASSRERESQRLIHARSTFYRRREWLEARFVTLASQSGQPRGLSWQQCDFADEVTFARDRETSLPRAFVAVTIGFEAIEGGGMEEVEAVSNLRAATAVFLYDGNQWTTQGRTIFNLNPVEAVEHFQNELELVE